MDKLSGSLQGYKTYIVGALAILLGWAAFLLGEPLGGQVVLSLEATIQLTVTAILGMTIRHGVANVSVNVAVLTANTTSKGRVYTQEIADEKV